MATDGGNQTAANLGRVGQCIYCGSTEALTDEHVIPRGLGGVAVLYGATCPACRDITSAFEGRVMGGPLLAYRTRLRLPTRHAKKRPTAFPARVRKGDDWMDVELPLDKYTVVGSFPRLPAPGVVVGRAAGAVIRVGGVAVTVVPKDEIGHNPLRRAGVDAIEISVPIEPAAFLRLIAKIAWGFSVSLFGLERLDPAILGVILGTDNDAPRWVGCPPPGGAVFDDPTGHFNVRVADVGGFVLAWIRLFGLHGAPEYLVVVGRLRASEAA